MTRTLTVFSVPVACLFSGSVYTRWGHASCPNSTETVYSGKSVSDNVQLLSSSELAVTTAQTPQCMSRRLVYKTACMHTFKKKGGGGLPASDGKNKIKKTNIY